MPSEAHMLWNLTFFCIHLVALCGFIVLYKSAPCWMQRLVVIGLAVSMALFTLGHFIAFTYSLNPSIGWWGSAELNVMARAIEHVAILLYVFRLIWQANHVEPPVWTQSSAPSLNSRA